MRVQIESPFAGETAADVATNVAYARAAVRDSLSRGEKPFASHLLYTQEGILDDTDADERSKGIAAGLDWAKAAAQKTVVYTDLGVTPGMHEGIVAAIEAGRPVEYRKIDWGRPSDTSLREGIIGEIEALGRDPLPIPRVDTPIEMAIWLRDYIIRRLREPRPAGRKHDVIRSLERKRLHEDFYVKPKLRCTTCEDSGWMKIHQNVGYNYQQCHCIYDKARTA